MSWYSKSGFELPTLQELYTRIHADLMARVDHITNRNKVLIAAIKVLIPILAAVSASEWYLWYKYLGHSVDQRFIQYSSEQSIVETGKEFDIQRKKATKAIRTATIYGLEGKAIPEGRILTDSTGLEFETLENPDNSNGNWIIAEESGVYFVNVPIKAKQGGIDYNIDCETELTITNAIEGVNSTAETVTHDQNIDGTNEESLKDFMYRIWYRMKNPPVAAAGSDYVNNVLKAANVSRGYYVRACPEPGITTILYTGVPEEEGGNGMVPNGGGAYRLKVYDVGFDGAKHYIKLSNTEVAAELNNTPSHSWFEDGYILYGSDQTKLINHAKIDDDGIQSDGEYWIIRFVSEPDPIILEGEYVHLLCTNTKLAWDEIYHLDEDGNEDRIPADAKAFVKLPEKVGITIKYTTPIIDETYNSLVRSELREMIRNHAALNSTIYNGRFHEVFTKTEGYVAHRIIDIEKNGESVGADADITVTGEQLQIFEAATYEDWS